MVDWLLDSDPAIRWQVLRDLEHAPAAVVAAERARVASEGWGATLLSLQQDNGTWAGNAFSQDHTDTFHVTELLRRLGLDPSSDAARAAIGRVRDTVTWGDGAWWNPPWADKGFFEGEVEPCINGNVVSTGSYFGIDMTPLVECLLGEQLADGGWNCEVENGATVSSFGTSINVIEGLLAYERAGLGTRTADARAAREQAEAYLLERRLLRRKSTGELIDPDFLRFSWPTWWRYDVLRALDHLRDAGYDPNDPAIAEAIAEAVDVVASKRTDDGRWLADVVHEGTNAVEVDDGPGQPSRWVTLVGTRVLGWAMA